MVVGAGLLLRKFAPPCGGGLWAGRGRAPREYSGGGGGRSSFGVDSLPVPQRREPEMAYSRKLAGAVDTETQKRPPPPLGWSASYGQLVLDPQKDAKGVPILGSGMRFAMLKEIWATIRHFAQNPVGAVSIRGLSLRGTKTFIRSGNLNRTLKDNV